MPAASLAPRSSARQPQVGRHERAIPGDGKGEVGAVVGRMVQGDREPESFRHKSPGRDELDGGALQELDSKRALVGRELGADDLLPEDVCAFRHQEVGSEELRAIEKGERSRRTGLLDDPLDGDAGVDDGASHRSDRPSRCRSSAGV